MDGNSQFEPTVLGAMWKYRWLVLAIVGTVTALGLIFALVSPTRYSATANLVVEDPRANALFDIGNQQNPQRYVADQAAILGSTIVAARAADTEPTLETVNDVLAGLQIFWDGQSDLIQATFVSDTPEAAVSSANAVAEAYEVVRRENATKSFSAALAELNDSILDVETQLTDLDTRIQAQLAGDPSVATLNAQLSENLARLVVVQAALPSATGDNLAALRAELDDILQQINTLQTLANLEAQRPEMALLLDEQQQTNGRKADLLRRRDELTVEARLASTGVTLADPALFAIEVGADLRRTTSVGFILGLLVAAGVSYLLALRNRTFTDRSQPEFVYESPLLAEVPDFRAERIKGEMPVKSNPASVSAEAFRFVSAAVDVEAEQKTSSDSPIAYFADDGPGLIRSFVVVSSTLNEGKTVVAANTALALARQGKRVLAIDTDFGHQRLTSLLAGPTKVPGPGLTDLVERGLPFERVVQTVAGSDGASLDLLSRGTIPVTAPDFFRSPGVKAFFEAIKEEYDLVVIDTPPLLHVAYASPIVRYADRVVVVVSHNGNVNQAEEMADRLSLLETDVMGYVYNKAPLREEMTKSEGSLKDVLGRTMRLPVAKG